MLLRFADRCTRFAPLGSGLPYIVHTLRWIGSRHCVGHWRTHERPTNMTPSPGGTLETILVVDDNPLLLRSVMAMLEAENFRVLSADGGPSALDLADRTTQTIDLLL